MGQIFQGAGVMLAADVNAPNATETAGPQTNAITPPFNNAKAIVWGTVILTPGAGNTTVVLNVRRNAAGENVVVNPSAISLTVIAATPIAIPFSYTDYIPDNRPVQYEVTVTVAGGAGAGTIKAGSSICAELISG